MARSETSICNVALGLIGAGRISSIDGTAAVERDCSSIFDEARDELLGKYHWRFARKQVELAQLTADPLFGYEYSYQLPADCVEPVLIDGDIEFKAIGDKLYCNQEEDVYLEYTAKVTNAATFTSEFSNILAHRLAGPLAMMVKKDKDLSLKMWDLYDVLLGRAQTADARADTTKHSQKNDYVDARS